MNPGIPKIKKTSTSETLSASPSRAGAPPIAGVLEGKGLTTSLDTQKPHSNESVESLFSHEKSTRAAELILESVGEDLLRPGLQQTPMRFAKALQHLYSGYRTDVSTAIGEGIFPAESTGLVSIRDIEFYSTCEHHLLPFWGHVSVAYYPRNKILGLSKLPRIVEVFSRRAQVQERLTQQVADAVYSLVDARAVVVRIQASHMCMMMRGVEKQNSKTLTEVCIGGDELTSPETDRIWSSVHL